jgi:uncharacterized protein (DUF488 family)
MGSPMIMTIGYGGKKPDEFFQELLSLEPDIVVDVREDPYHAYLGVYTLPYLEKKLKEKYIWIRELGNNTRSLPPVLVDEDTGIRKLLELSDNHRRIVLLCTEKNEKDCHRKYIKDKVSDMLISREK